MVNSTLLQEDGRFKLCDSLKYDVKLVETFPSKAYVVNHVIVLVVNIFVSLLTLFLNLATIVTFRSSNHLQKKLCHFIIFVQSCNDLGIGLIVSPLYSILLASELLGSTNCKVYYAFYILFLTTAGFSLIILSAMNVERYMGIVHPLYHRNKVTKKKLLVYILSLSALYLCVSFASFVLGIGILNAFSGYMFVLHFVSTVCIYVKIFLVAKAHIKKSEARVNPPKEEAQVRRNEQNIIRRENDCTALNITLSRSLVNERTISMKQENSLNAEGRSSNNQENILHHQAEQSYDGEKNSQNEEEKYHHRKSLERNEGTLSHNQGSSSNNKSDHSNNQRVQSDNQDSSSDNQDNQSDNQGRETENYDSSPDNQCNRLENQNNQGRTTGDQGNQTHTQKNQQHNNSDDKTSSNRKSEQEFLKKIKLAKSCMIVVICSFISFLLPAVFQPLALNFFHEVVIDGWFTVLVLLNSSLNSLIFFWRNKTLRNEAKKVLKKFRS